MLLQGSMIGASLAALLLAPSAFAQSTATASATIENFSYELVDPAPEDGIAPAVQLSSGQRRAEANLFGYPERIQLANARSLDYGGVAVTAAGAVAESSLAPRKARSSATAVTAAYSEALAYDTIDFVLSPHARLIFSGDAEVAVLQNLASNVFASAKIFGEIPSSPLLSTRSQFSSSIESALGDNAGMLSVVVNSTDSETTGFVQLRTDAQVVSRVPPIPEPPQALLTFAGLGLFAAAGVRRQIAARAGAV
ncbi:MAG: hypothetical protein ABIT83_04145 [Massilia sp.]